MLHIRTQPSLNRDFTLLSLFIVFLMLMMSAWVAFETYDSQKKQITQRLQSATSRMDNALNLEIQHTRYIIETISHQIIDTDTQQLSKIAKIFQSFSIQNRSDQAIFSWINREQQLVVNSSFGVLENPIDVSDRDYVKRALAEPWKITLGRPIKGRITKRWVLPMSIGIASENGTFIGVLYVGLIIDTLKHEAAHAIGDRAIDFSITNRAFSILTESDSKNGGYKRFFDLSTLVKKDFITPQRRLYSAAKPFDPRSIYAYYETSEKQPFIYFLMFDRAESIAQLRQLLLARILQLLAVGTFLLFVLWTVRKRIIQPVLLLSQHTHAATLGNSFDANTNEGPQEIQTLTREIYKFWLFIQERKRIEAGLRLKLSELVRIRESATLTNQVKADFFSFIAESLRTPLQMIREQSETIKDQHFGPITNQKYLKNADDIYHHADAVLHTLTDIMKIAASENGLIALKEEEIHTVHSLQKTITRFHDEHNHNYLVQMDSASPFPNLYGDKLRINQLFFHVLAVAARQISSGDVIRISSNIRSGELSIFFAYTHDSRRALQTLSVSMSVALARLLISLHSGTLEIKTTTDRITTITLKFPASRLL